MGEYKLRRSVPLLFFGLIRAASSQVPNHDSPVRARRSQQIALVLAEFHLVDFISVLSQAEELRSHISCIPDSDTLVGTSRDHEVLVEGRVVNAHDGSHVRIYALRCVSLSHVPDLQFLVI